MWPSGEVEAGKAFYSGSIPFLTPCFFLRQKIFFQSISLLA